MYQMNEAEKELVVALRSGKYQQGINCLRPTENSFCCLGVACDIFLPGYWSVENHNGHMAWYSKNTQGSVLPYDVVVKLKWYDEQGTTTIPVNRDDLDSMGSDFYDLATLNDSGFTFNQIADIIEAGLVCHDDEEYALLEEKDV